MATPRLVVIVGPTGAGKTALAVALARAAGGEIVSCDSQQVYAGMDLGTGKASAAERAAAPHHLLDVIGPDAEMTAARFAALADAAIAEIAGRGRPVIVCGGTGLYVRALLFGLFAGPPAVPAVRAELEAEVAAAGSGALWARLAAADPDSAARIDPNDRKRLIRALEVIVTTGVALSEHHRRHDHRRVPPRYPHRLIGVAPPRADLYAAIDARCDAMVAAGLVEEVAQLRAAGHVPPLRSQQAIGYAELHEHLAGRFDLSRAIELMKRNSRRYARRQLSWYRSQTAVEWVTAADRVDLGDLAAYLTGPRHG
ncbi:MAG: tRNA (adenosine(37)-N6)-dimethylallyltransferase MiaA [Myxococcales bacterium]|nr:tRNA (adenosine(37)-N6)-dimethylallyltransferase MiaA [Myxococcales bacterium]